MVFMVFKEGHLVRACPERQSDAGVSERPGQEAAEPAVVVPPAATVRPAVESPGVAAAPEQTESEPQAQPAAQKPTGATLTPEEPCVAEPVTVKSCSAELVSVRHGGTDRDQEKPCLTEPDRERPCSVDSGAVLELPALAEAVGISDHSMYTLNVTRDIVRSLKALEIEMVELQCLEATGNQGHIEALKSKKAKMNDLIRDLLSEPTEIRKQTVSFYSKLYSSERSGAQIVEESFLKDLPKLSEQAARELDRDLTLAELHKALQGQDVLEVLNDSVNVGQLPLSCRRAVLTLLPKKGDLTHLKNWRPVSLLCTDIKLLSKALASRLTKVMEQITHQDQSYCVPVHWLLEEPLVYGGRLDISGVTVPALSRTLVSSGIVTLRELVNVAGSDLSRAEDLAARMGLRSRGVVNQLLHRWRSALTSEERVQLMDYQHTETGPAEDESFPRLNIAPDLDGCAGPLLECRSEGGMDFGSVSGKLLYRACVKVLNKKKLSGRVDTPWRSVLGFNDVKPEWTHCINHR
ncbi:hypothetical protein QTP70_008215 [Hemibagrus guttatus]|uniref:Uncharacterized protein n=1 Tax=Hemibagrus guttatus TaxID=175788 RepID=A0AAE0R6N9_9TELE|nr:hypothetical protein QTP70_008215 [Hemibagrus guttatus]